MESATSSATRVMKTMDVGGCIEKLEPYVKNNFRALLFLMALTGYGRARVISGVRTLEFQKRLYGKGRNKEECWEAGVPKEYAAPAMDQVTWSLPEESKHVHALAIDVDLSMYRDIVWGEIGHLAATCGLNWGGEWRVKDYGHFEL